MRSLTFLRVITLAVTAAAPLSSSCAEPTQDDAKQNAKDKAKVEAKSDDAVVYTNDDLERLFGASSAPAESVEKVAAAKEGHPATDPLGALQKEQEAAGDRQRQVAAAEARVVDAEAQVKALERRSLEIANPYLPRPQLTPEEAQAWKDLDGVQRLQQNKAEIEDAKKAVEKAKEDLDKAQSGQ